MKSYIDTACNEGKAESMVKFSSKMKQKGFPLKDILEITGLAKMKINKLQQHRI